MRTYNFNIYYYKLKLKFLYNFYFKLKTLYYVYKHSENKFFARNKAKWIYSIFSKKPNFSSLINTCILSGKTKAVFTKFKYNRFILKKLTSSGDILSFSRNSW